MSIGCLRTALLTWSKSTCSKSPYITLYILPLPNTVVGRKSCSTASWTIFSVAFQCIWDLTSSAITFSVQWRSSHLHLLKKVDVPFVSLEHLHCPILSYHFCQRSGSILKPLLTGLPSFIHWPFKQAHSLCSVIDRGMRSMFKCQDVGFKHQLVSRKFWSIDIVCTISDLIKGVL